MGESDKHKHIIAGGAGFLGSHIVSRLLYSKDVQKVVVLDNFSSGSISNLTNVRNDPRLQIIETDITKELFDPKENFDWVWHLAALANPTDYEKNPVDTLSVNSDGNKNLINLARNCKANYVYFSSSEIYGLYNELPPSGFNEKTSISRLILGKPRSPYAVGKCFGEELTRHLCSSYGTKHLIIRPFNVYGTNMDVKTNYGRVIPNFITWALQKEPLQINGDGTQIRTFCYVDDFTDGVLRLVHHPAPPKIVNIGSTIPVSIIHLAEIINQLLDNQKAGYRFVDRYSYEPLVRVPDIQVITGSTGWSPKIDLKTGLGKTINWLKNRSIFLEM